jgi:DNA-binding NarL/FixJ family response regulator
MALAAALGGSSLDNRSEAALSRIARYCQVSWRNAGIRRQEWEDCTQQVIVELLASTALDTALAERAAPADVELKRAVWRTIKRHQRQAVHRPLDENPGGKAGSGDGNDWAEVEEVALRCLTDRQRQVLGMVRDGWQVHQIADQLGLPPARVSDTKYRAIAALRQQLLG